jgi:ligand-binding sensor domain-containing protein
VSFKNIILILTGFRPIALVMVCWLSLFLPTYAQKIEFERHSLAEGLSNLSVQCIFQDKQGLIWVGTLDGLNSWDGYSFTTYRHDPKDSTTLSHSCIWSIYQDTRGDLWVGTLFGLNRFDSDTKTFQRYHTFPEGVMPQEIFLKNSIRAITEINPGQLVLGTWGNGLRLFDTNIKSMQPKEIRKFELASDSVLSIAGDPENLWVGTTRGLTHIDLTKNVSRQYKHNADDDTSLSDDYVLKVYKNQKGQLWVGTVNGLNRFDAETKTFEQFHQKAGQPYTLSNKSIQAICEDRRGRMWIGTRDGLNLFDPVKKTLKIFKNQPNSNISLSDNFVTSVFEEASGHLIIGTYGNGINVLDGHAKKFTSYSHDPTVPNSLSANLVWSVFKDSKERLWVGTSKGLNLLKEDGSFENYRKYSFSSYWFPDQDIISIAEDARGRLWLGTLRNGLIIVDHINKKSMYYRHDPKRQSTLANNNVSSLYQDKSGNMWVGTYGALSLFEPASNTFTHYRTKLNDSIPRQNYINHIHENSKGQLWLATHTGASLFEPISKTFTNYLHKPDDTTSLSATFVMHILEDSKGRIWLGTDHGLNLLNNQTQTFNTLHYGGKEFPGDYFDEILEDGKGRFWSGTNKGLICLTLANSFAPDSGRWGTIRNYTQADGLQHDEFNAGAFFKDKKGTIYLGGVNGFTIFHPDSIEDDHFVPPVFVSRLAIFNKPIHPGKNESGFILPTSITETNTLVLSYKESVFTLEFAALAYARAKEFKYAYQLEHFEEDWNFVDAGRRFATYTNLDPGTYVFRVKAANRDGVWGEERLLTIFITPPWWKTWWFKMVLVLSGVGAVAFLLYFRTKRISQLNQALKVAVMLKTNELEEKNEELVVQTTLLEQKNQELERAKGQLEFELQYQHQRQLLKLSIDVQEGERKRIAQDLHDELGAVLSIARMHIVHLEGLQSEANAQQGLQQARILTENALSTMRRISHELMPLQLQKYGLIKTLEALSKQINDANKIRVELTSPETEPSWTKPTELGLYRILMEMINNTIKHAHADYIRIKIDQSLDHIIVTYSDNGKGLSDNYNKGLGLQNIDARINAVGGTFEIVKEIGTGFNARIIIPL